MNAREGRAGRRRSQGPSARASAAATGKEREEDVEDVGGDGRGGLGAIVLRNERISPSGKNMEGYGFNLFFTNKMSGTKLTLKRFIQVLCRHSLLLYIQIQYLAN